MKYYLGAFAFLAMPVLAAAALPQTTPGPLLGAVAGPWGLVAGVAGYGAYRLYRRGR